ncbi:MAG: tetratricopeptide repeat protein [Myxococcales bacterium]|nr:tetratricopeptide repeat protein [Myxococcales bacterium]
MPPRPARLLLATLLASLPLSATLRAQDLSRLTQELTDIESDAQQLQSFELRRARLRSPTHVEERLTDGELFYRLQDYVRASVIFTDIVENYPSHPAFPDALFFLGDSLFRAGDHLGARTRFRLIIDRASENAFRPYVQRALGRLIEIAIHIRDFDGVDTYFAHLAQLPPSEVEAATAYYRAKYLYNVAVPLHHDEGQVGAGLDPEQLERARVAFEAVSARSPYYSQARYFIGVIHTLRRQYPEAIQAFQRVRAAEVTTEEQREVAELTELALGRLYYEADQLEEAVQAYQSVPRTSAHFESALYEIAWVFLRMGDSTRAEQALEVLSIASPDSKMIPDAQLLRGNLLLRGGRFETSVEVFKSVSAEFEPLREQLKMLVARHEDPERYFRKLVHDNLSAFDANAFLPPAAKQWAQMGSDMERAMATLSDLSQAQQLVRETEEIVHRLSGALASDNRVNIFSDLRMHRERTIGLRNRLARVRQELIAIDEKSLKRFGNAELSALRKRRRELERELGGMPTTANDFQNRNDTMDRGFRGYLKQLNKLEVALMGMEAKIVATDRFIADAFSDPQQAAGVAAFRQELETHRDAIDGYREQIRKLEMDVEAGRIRVGVGDQRFRRDDKLRQEHRKLVAKERSLLVGLGGRSSGQVDTLFRRIDRVEVALDGHDTRVDQVVSERVQQMEAVVGEESVKLDGYRARMAALEDTTEEVVGGIAYANFKQVSDQFYDLVLRADVGLIDVAWSVREEHRMRLELLMRERTRALQAIDAEYSEIMDREPGGAR